MRASHNMVPTLLPVARADEFKDPYCLQRRMKRYADELKQQSERPVVRMVRKVAK